MTSFYAFAKDNKVKVSKPNFHNIPIGTTGHIHARRGQDGKAQYLVKIPGRAHPYHFEEDELVISTDT
jgi:hypothetical protein